MGFLKRLGNLLSPSGGGDDYTYWIYVRCNRCSEKIRGRVDLRNELSVNYNDKGNTFFCRKVLMGEEHCFQKIEVQLTFDKDRKLIDRQITGGQFISEEEFLSQSEPEE
ncbi:MAG: hypothetical protein PVF74_08850 [Anaerolineales bacterium]|jgi:hypothetical protein